MSADQTIPPEPPAEWSSCQRERHSRDLADAMLKLADVAEWLGLDPRAGRAHDLSRAVGALRRDLGLGE